MAAVWGFIKRKIVDPLVQVLKSGVTPEKLSLSVACGFVGGLFPVPGVTSLPVAAAIFMFALNPVAAMTINYAVTPLNIASVPFFMYYGAILLGTTPVEFSMAKLTKGLSEDTVGTLIYYQWALLHGITAWIAISAPATAVIYYCLLPILRAVMPKRTVSKGAKLV